MASSLAKAAAIPDSKNAVAMKAVSQPVASVASLIPPKPKPVDAEREKMIAKIRAEAASAAAKPPSVEETLFQKLTRERKAEAEKQIKSKQLVDFRKQFKEAFREGMPENPLFKLVDATFTGELHDTAVTLMAQWVVEHDQETQKERSVEDAKNSILSTAYVFNYRHHCSCPKATTMPYKCPRQIVVNFFSKDTMLEVWRYATNLAIDHVVTGLTNITDIEPDAVHEDYDDSHLISASGVISYGLLQLFPELTADVTISVQEETVEDSKKRRRANGDETDTDNEAGVGDAVETPTEADDEDDFANEKFMQARQRKRLKSKGVETIKSGSDEDVE